MPHVFPLHGGEGAIRQADGPSPAVSSTLADLGSPPREALDGEHKPVTVFCGALAEVPTLATRLGPEAMYHLMHDVVSTHVGMEIAVDESVWSSYASMSACRLAKELLGLAKGVQLSRYPKKKRGPKKPPPRKKSGAGSPHVSTARVLAQSKRR